MTSARTFTELMAGLLFPLIANAQGANSKGELEALAPTGVAVQARVKGLK